MIESVRRIISAAPIPCTVRAPISISPLVASPQASDEAANTTSPAMKMRRRPRKSASLPPVSMSTANVSA